MFLRQRILMGVFALLFTLAFSSPASAQTAMFPMAGSWAQNRGNLIDIPITGDKQCAINRNNNAVVPPFVMGDFGKPGLRAANAGCIPGFGTVTVMGAAPRTITLKGTPAGGGGAIVFQQTGMTKQSAVVNVPTVIQLATNFSLTGPGSVSVTSPSPNPSSGDATGTLMQSNHLAAAANGRAGANFAWCPGGATQNGTWSGSPVPPVANQMGGCTTPDPAKNGATTTALNGLVRYRAGTNVFGGTMTMLIKGSGTLTRKFAPGFMGTVRIVHSPIGGMGAQHPGDYYAKYDYDVLGQGTVKQSPVYSVGGKVIASITPSPTVMAGGTTNLNYGFSWTTGHVYVRNGPGAPLDATTTLSATGTDARAPDGQGQITLVAGGASHRINQNAHFAAIDVVRLKIGDNKTPSSSPAGLAAGAVLMLLAVGYAVRRRL